MVLLFRKKVISLFCFLIILVFAIFLSFNMSNSFATDLDKKSFFNIDVSSTLNDITKSNEKIAYLTFDDGPTLKATGKILDILKAENVKATFFVVGKHVKEHPELVKREYDEGHYIANHGYNHNNKLLYSSMENFKKEVENTDLEIATALNLPSYCSHIFRFPNGYMSKNYKYEKKEALNVLSNLNYVYVDWNCLNKDSETKYSDAQLLANLKKSAKNKGTLVILMHDTADVNKTYNVLKASIDYLKNSGYSFRNFYDFVNKSEKNL